MVKNYYEIPKFNILKVSLFLVAVFALFFLLFKVFVAERGGSAGVNFFTLIVMIIGFWFGYNYIKKKK